MSVHKSQGAGFRRVGVPIFPNRLLDRTLLYTAVTYVTDQVVLVGDLGEIAPAVTDPLLPDERMVGLCL